MLQVTVIFCSLLMAAMIWPQRDAQAQAVFKQLAGLIEQQQLYLQPRLAVVDLAKLTGLGTGLTPSQYQPQRVQNPNPGRIKAAKLPR